MKVLSFQTIKTNLQLSNRLPLKIKIYTTLNTYFTIQYAWTSKVEFTIDLTLSSKKF